MFPPRTQGELIRWARGKSTQAEFAAAHGVAKSSLSRYEAEKLGAPTRLINDCLSQLAEFLVAKPGAAEVSRLHLPVNSGEALEQRDSFARIVQGPLDASPTEL